MKYRVRREGVELGVFPVEEIRRRRESGELTGREYVQAEGRKDWQPLDLFLRYGDRVAASSPQQKYAGAPKTSPALMVVLTVAAVIFVIGIGVGVYNAVRVFNRLNLRSATMRSQSAALAARPVHWTTNSLTEAAVKSADKEFDRRQWLESYQQLGRHDAPWDGLATRMLDAWLARHYESSETNLAWLEKLSDELARQTNCDDPLALTIAGISSEELFEKGRRLERAMKGFAQSNYRAYPKFVAAVRLSTEMDDNQVRRNSLDNSALESLRLAFADGSLLSRDQPVLAEIFLNGWGHAFFERNHTAVCAVTKGAGKDYQWLTLVLDGEGHITEAWKARGNGYSDSVTSEGWKGFNTHIALARTSLNQAWKLRPELPQAACRMMTVALGESDLAEMRRWFDRAVGAEIDYRYAWSEMRWGLRPRWFGNEEAMLALGVMAVDTGRFDTDAPRMLYDSIYDVETEEELEPGQHIYSRSDVWPHLQKMYEGYIAEPSASAKRNGWRSAYASAAYFAGKYDVAREQFEALNWEPAQTYLSGWNVECSLMPLEVAARTGLASGKIERAESHRTSGETGESLALYREIADSSNADTRTREFVRHRIAELEVEQRLEKGEWVDFQPKDDHDPNWVFARGTAHVLPDGALEVESGPLGHFLYSRVRVGSAFEARGEFEVVRSSTPAFQAGLVMGMTDVTKYEWNAFRMKRNRDENEVASFSHGWGKNGTSRKLTLHDTTNSFDFSFQDSEATASVNGKEVMRNAKEPRKLALCDDCHLLGLGAYNDVNDTVIRYRHVQVRRLTPAGKASSSAK